MTDLPPRPTDPDALMAWTRAMDAKPVMLTPVLKQRANRHRPVVMNAADQSTNWSGYAVNGANFTSVSANIVVPAVKSRVADGSWNYLSAWVGIDGNGSGDVLQAGVACDVSTNLGAPETDYFPWFEWYPNVATQILNLPCEAGDTFYVHVWATDATHGHAYLQNLTENMAVTIPLTAPAGTSLAGNSVEWIVEAPEINGAIAVPPHFGQGILTACAGHGASVVKPSTAGAVALSMVQGGVVYSVPSGLGAGGVLLVSA